MPPGDAQRAWFPEMLRELEDFWRRETTWQELAAFCQAMTEKRESIKQSLGIRPLRSRCRDCGGAMVLPPISIRSALFALKTLSRIDEDEFKSLDQAWTKYRKLHGLDRFGRGPSVLNPHSCS
jgi:hypothetical protein